MASPMRQTQPGRYLCEAMDGSANQEILPLVVDRELRIGFRLVKDDFDSKKAALASIGFEGSAGRSRVAVGKAQNDRFGMYAAVQPPGDADRVVFEYPVTDKWTILKLKLDRHGYLNIRGHDLTQRYKWGPVTRAGLHCQYGEFEIDIWPRSYVPVGGGG